MTKTGILAVIFCILFIAPPGFSLVIRRGQIIDVLAEEVINDDLIAFGRQVNIRGKVNGDVVAFAQLVYIEGEISGTVVAGGSTVNVAAKSSRSVWAMGGNVQVSGQVANNAVLFGGTLYADQNTRIGADLVAFGGQLNMSGQAGGKVSGSVGEFFMIGKSGTVDIRAGETQVAAQAQVNGDFTVRGEKEPKIAPGAKITGQTKFIKSEEEKKAGGVGLSFFGIVLLIASIIVGVLFIAFSARHARRITDALIMTPWKSLLAGFVFIFGLPVAVVILLVMLIGLPIAVYGVFIYLTVLYLSSIFVGMAVGEKIIRIFKKDGGISLYLAFILGVVILFVVGLIPILGLIVKLLTIIFGSGMVVIGQMNLIKEGKAKELI